jgi:hypothetical protein
VLFTCRQAGRGTLPKKRAELGGKEMSKRGRRAAGPVPAVMSDYERRPEGSARSYRAERNSRTAGAANGLEGKGERREQAVIEGAAPNKPMHAEPRPRSAHLSTSAVVAAR